MRTVQLAVTGSRSATDIRLQIGAELGCCSSNGADVDTAQQQHNCLLVPGTVQQQGHDQLQTYGFR